MLASGSPQSMVPSACAKCTSGTSEDGNGRLPCGSLLPVPSSSSCDAAVATWANATSKNENALRSISSLQSMLSSSSWDLGYWPMTDEHAALPGSSLQSRLSSSSWTWTIGTSNDKNAMLSKMPCCQATGANRTSGTSKDKNAWLQSAVFNSCCQAAVGIWATGP